MFLLGFIAGIFITILMVILGAVFYSMGKNDTNG